MILGLAWLGDNEFWQHNFILFLEMPHGCVDFEVGNIWSNKKDDIVEKL